MAIISSFTENTDPKLSSFLAQIRSLVDIRLEPDDLPDSVIQQPVFLRQAEREILGKAKISEDTYRRNSGANVVDSRTAAQIAYAESFELAVMYQTAIYIIPALSQILEAYIKRDRLDFAEIKWDDKIKQYEDIITDIITPIIPPDPDAGPITLIAKSIRKRVYY